MQAEPWRTTACMSNQAVHFERIGPCVWSRGVLDLTAAARDRSSVNSRPHFLLECQLCGRNETQGTGPSWTASSGGGSTR